jgi:hypothetical protein
MGEGRLASCPSDAAASPKVHNAETMPSVNRIVRSRHNLLISCTFLLVPVNGPLLPRDQTKCATWLRQEESSMATVDGTNNSETLDALDGVTNGGDTIYGRGGNDTIFGLGGDDYIQGGSGADDIDGGNGIDTAGAASHEVKTLGTQEEVIPWQAYAISSRASSSCFGRMWSTSTRN